MRTKTRSAPRIPPPSRSWRAPPAERAPRSPPRRSTGRAAQARRPRRECSPVCLLRREDGAATLRGAAAAGVELLVFRGVILGTLVLVIVEQFLAGPYVLPRLDEDALAVGDRLAVAVAGVVEEARVVP